MKSAEYLSVQPPGKNSNDHYDHDDWPLAQKYHELGLFGKSGVWQVCKMSRMTNPVAFSTADRKLPLSRQPRPTLNCSLIELLAGQS